MQTLPTSPRKAFRTSLWWVLNLTMGLAAGLGAFGLGLGTAASTLPLAFAIIALLGSFSERLPWLAFRGWKRFSKLLAYVTSRTAIVVVYGIITMLSLAGSRIDVRGSDGTKSLWVDFGASGQALLGAGHRAYAEEASVFRWALHSRNLWIIPLIPWFAILNALHSRGETPEPLTNIYTLY